MLMLFVPFVVRFRADSCLPSARKTIGYFFIIIFCPNSVKNLTQKTQIEWSAQVFILANKHILCDLFLNHLYKNISVKFYRLLRNSLRVPSDSQKPRRTFAIRSKMPLAHNNPHKETHTCKACLHACCSYKLNRSTYRPAASAFLTAAVCGDKNVLRWQLKHRGKTGEIYKS